jgi:hypothetical protein
MSDKPRVLISYDGWPGSEEKDAAAGEKLWVLALRRRDRPRAGAARRPADRAAYRSMNIYNQDPAAKSYIAKTFKGELDMWILVDGVYTGTFVVTADRADGERQDLALVGGWGIGIAHKVEVRFDGTGSGQATYIDGVSLSEVTEGTNSTIATPGTELYWVGGGAL